MALSDYSLLPKAAGNQLGAGGLKIQESSTHAYNALGGIGGFTQVTADSNTGIAQGAATVTRKLQQKELDFLLASI